MIFYPETWGPGISAALVIIGLVVGVLALRRWRRR
jgi:hypothetical protein